MIQEHCWNLMDMRIGGELSEHLVTTFPTPLQRPLSPKTTPGQTTPPLAPSKSRNPKPLSSLPGSRSTPAFSRNPQNPKPPNSKSPPCAPRSLEPPTCRFCAVTRHQNPKPPRSSSSPHSHSILIAMRNSLPTSPTLHLLGGCPSSGPPRSVSRSGKKFRTCPPGLWARTRGRRRRVSGRRFRCPHPLSPPCRRSRLRRWVVLVSNI
jgi:hypothetical protein